MEDFKIRRGPSSVLFSSPGIVNPRLILEEGCWYLCTDTAELFLCVLTNLGDLTLKRINGAKSADIDNEAGGGGDCEFLLTELEERVASLENLRLFKKIAAETELPTNFEAEDFNPNITYYIPLDDYYASTFIFDSEAKSWLCTNRTVIPDSIFVSKVDTDADGNLVIHYSNGDSSLLNPFNNTGIGISTAFINTDGELVLAFSDTTELTLGRVVGKDGLTTSIKIGPTLYSHVNGIIELPEFATQAYVDEKFNSISHPTIPSKVSELENDARYVTESQAAENYIKKTEFPDANELATKNFVENAIIEAKLGDEVLILDNYATKKDLEGLASESYVDAQIAAIRQPEMLILYGGDATPDITILNN